MFVTRVWATPVSPTSPWGGILSLLPVAAVEVISIGGVYVGLLLERGGGEILFWAVLGLSVLIGSWAILRRRNRPLRVRAERLSAERPGTEFFLFTDSGVGPWVTDWRDWREVVLTGGGFILITDDGVEVWSDGTTPTTSLRFSEIVAVEDIRVWSAWVWAPQLRVKLTNDREIVAALTFAGIRGAFGFTIFDMRRLARVFESKAPGITRRTPFAPPPVRTAFSIRRWRRNGEW